MVDGPRYVDINIFVYWLGKHPTLGEVALEWIRRIERSPRGSYVTSSLTLYEALVIISGLVGRSLKDKTLIEGVVNPVTNLKGLVIEPLRPEDYTRALNQIENSLKERNLRKDADTSKYAGDNYVRIILWQDYVLNGSPK